MYAAAFESCRGVTSWDQPLMLFMLPMLMVEAAGPGGAGLQLVAQEIHAVMQVRCGVLWCAGCDV